MEQNKERKIYSSMKERKISTLDLHEMLSKVGIDVAKRTLQTYLDDDFEKCGDSRLKTVALSMVKGYDELKESIKLKIERPC
jgi:hypothetical protein